MKIAKKEPTSITGTGYVTPGDTVTISVSHNIKIDGQDSWVKYELIHQVVETEYEDIVDELDMLKEHVTSGVIKVAEQAAAKVMERNQ